MQLYSELIIAIDLMLPLKLQSEEHSFLSAYYLFIMVLANLFAQYKLFGPLMRHLLIVACANQVMFNNFIN